MKPHFQFFFLQPQGQSCRALFAWLAGSSGWLVQHPAGERKNERGNTTPHFSCFCLLRVQQFSKLRLRSTGVAYWLSFRRSLCAIVLKARSAMCWQLSVLGQFLPAINKHDYLYKTTAVHLFCVFGRSEGRQNIMSYFQEKTEIISQGRSKAVWIPSMICEHMCMPR